MATYPQGTEKIPSDPARWPKHMPKYERGSKTVIHYPDGKRIDLRKLKDVFGK